MTATVATHSQVANSRTRAPSLESGDVVDEGPAMGQVGDSCRFMFVALVLC